MANMPTEEDIAWMMANIDDTLVADIIACCAVCAAASVIILYLRIWSRFKVGLGPIFSDWLVVGSVVMLFFCSHACVRDLIMLTTAGRYST